MFLLLMFLMFMAKPSYAAEKIIIPGNSIGDIHLTIQPDEIVSQLGHPTSVEPSGDLLLVSFKNEGLLFIYNKQAALLFIITFNPAVKDSSNLGVNSTTKAITARYGTKYKQMEQGKLVTWLFIEQGIGFTFDAGKVVSVWIFQGTTKIIDT